MTYTPPKDITITIPGHYRSMLDRALLRYAAELEQEVEAYRVRTKRGPKARLPAYMAHGWNDALWLRELARQVMP